MTGGPAQTSPKPERESFWAELAADPAIRAIALYALIALGAVFAAYMAIFTTFVDYDDEGTLLVSLHSFVGGDALYSDVFSPYGPFYYELFGGFFSLSGIDITTDASRSIVIVLWVATSLLLGLACQRLTRSLLLGGAGMIVSFAALYALFPEPMHPHGLLVLLLGGFVFAVVAGPGRRVALCGGFAGALLAAALMTKINFGAYAIAGVVLAAALTWAPLSRAWLRWPVIAVFLAMPFVVMASDLREDWVRTFIAMHVLGSAAIIAAAWPLRARRGEEQVELGRWLLAAVAGCIGAIVAILATIMLLGTGPSDLYDGMIVQALNVRNVAAGAFPTPEQAVYWGVAALAAAVLSAKLRSASAGEPALWPALLRVLAALTIWLTIGHAAPFGLNPETPPVVLPLLLAWVAAIPPSGALEPPFKRFLRVALPAVAAASVLGVYPVPGAQIGVASMMFVPVGALCIADALSSLRAWSAARGKLELARLESVVAVAAAALVGMLGLGQIVLPAASDAITYGDWPSLPFEGAGAVHLAPEQVDEYVGVVDFLEENECTAFIGYPNVDSLYLWSSIDPPKPSAPGAWVSALDEDEQDRILAQLRASPRPCVLYNEKVASFWLFEKAAPDTALTDYIFEDFETVGTSGQFELKLPKQGS